MGGPAVKRVIKRFFWALAGLILTAFIAVSLAAMWMVGQLPH